MKNISIVIITSIFLASLIFSSCNKEKYPHEKGFKLYMKEEFDINISNSIDDIYYILPLSDCVSCLSTQLNLEYLSSIENTIDKLTIVLVGITNNSKYIYKRKKISSLNKVLIDTNNSIINYQTGLAKPMLLHVKNGEIQYYLQIKDFKIGEVEKYILSKS